MPNAQSQFGLATKYRLQRSIANCNGRPGCCWLSGYEGCPSAHHYRVIQSLAYTIKANTSLIAQLDKFRKKRNIGSYEQAGAVSEQEVKEMVALAKDLRDEVVNWLRLNHPELL